MSDTQSKLPRREFLRGAVGVVGASVLGARTAFAGGPASVGPNPQPGTGLSIAYWDGTSLTPAEKLAYGDSSLSNIEFTVRGYGDGSAILGLDTIFTVSGSPLPFPTWTAPPQGVNKVAILVPLDPVKGLHLTSHVAGQSGSASIDTFFSFGGDRNPKLREGSYVVVAGAIDWNAYHFDPTNEQSPLSPVYTGKLAPMPPYLVLTVERA